MRQQHLRTLRTQEFGPVTERGVYLNHAGVGPAPARVVRAVQEAVAVSAPDPFGFFTEQCLPARDRARARLGRLMGVSPDHLAFVKNTGHGLSLIADGLKLDAGDTVVSVDCEYPSVVYPWYAQADRGVETRLVTPKADGSFTPEDLAARMDSRTKVVTLSWVQFGTGFRADLKAFADMAHAHGALCVVDVIQGLGALPLDLEAAGVDMAVSGVHKWQLAPGGSGALYVAPHALDRLRLVNMGAGAVVDMMKFDPLDFTVKPGVQRYEEGTPNGLGMVGLDAALSLIEEAGIEAVAEQVLSLAAYAAEALDKRGCEVTSPREDASRSGLVMFRHPSRANEDVLQVLTDAGVTAAVRGGRVRFAPHFYNTPEEIDRAVEALP